jgi:hypothetical protein
MLVNLQLLLLDITSSLLTLPLTYTLAPYTGSTATTYTTVGVIGSTPKGWDASTAMAKSTFDAHSWTLGVTH